MQSSRQWRRMVGWSVVLSGLLIGSLAWAQQSTIEELERSFNEKRAAKAKKEARERAQAPKKQRAEEAAARQAKEESERQAAARQAKEESERQAAARFVLTHAGTIRDSTTGMEWSQSDNGSDIDWEEATRYCDNQGGNWRLPTSSELLGIYDTSLSAPCGNYTCNTSSKFGLTGPRFWTNERRGSSKAFFVTLYHGTRYSLHVLTRSPFGLCVCGVPEHGAGVFGYLVI